MNLLRTCRLHHAPRIPPPSLSPPSPLFSLPPSDHPPPVGTRALSVACCCLLLALCASLKQPCIHTHPQDEYAEELLGEDHYATQFFNALNSDETEAAIEEVGVAVGEAKQEHDLLGAFASGLDAPLE